MKNCVITNWLEQNKAHPAVRGGLKEFCMYVIMLTGESNVGKTTILNKVYDELLLQEWKIVHEKKLLEAPEEKDFSSVLSKEGKRIAFYTRGDYATFVIGAMDIYACVDIDILIIACNNDRIDKHCESVCVGNPRKRLQEDFPNAYCLIPKQGKAGNEKDDDKQTLKAILDAIDAHIR